MEPNHRLAYAEGRPDIHAILEDVLSANSKAHVMHIHAAGIVANHTRIQHCICPTAELCIAASCTSSAAIIGASFICSQLMERLRLDSWLYAGPAAMVRDVKHHCNTLILAAQKGPYLQCVVDSFAL